MSNVNTKMTAIADEIRTLSGTTEAIGLDTMASHIGEANNEVDSQVELLAQAVAALEGKASGSIDDVTAETNVYTEKLASLESAISALETELNRKASGGGSVETCTVEISEPYNGCIYRLIYQDQLGDAKHFENDPMTSCAGTHTVACGTILALFCVQNMRLHVTNLTQLHRECYLVTAKAGETATITVSKV